VLLKGGHLADSDEVVDLFAARRETGGRMHREIRHPRLAVNAHGTGCTLAAAIAAQLALGAPLIDACREASDYVHRALRLGSRPGRSDILVLDHFGAAPR
jgi:hydroxymethylpyrimidine/phosphomethylpyrimidine kinase